jgi:hypothetical protein
MPWHRVLQDKELSLELEFLEKLFVSGHATSFPILLRRVFPEIPIVAKVVCPLLFCSPSSPKCTLMMIEILRLDDALGSGMFKWGILGMKKKSPQ